MIKTVSKGRECRWRDWPRVGGRILTPVGEGKGKVKMEKGMDGDWKVNEALILGLPFSH